jgi:RNA-binding protein NOB1
VSRGEGLLFTAFVFCRFHQYILEISKSVLTLENILSLTSTKMATDTPKPIHSLVLDAGPIIKNEPSVSTLLGQAETLYTIPAVIDEIRDAVTRARIENTLLPFLTLRSPRPASVKVISDFARKTGDLEVLSRPDIHLMALAYELECERNHGDWRLRSTPGQKGLNGVKPESLKGDAVRGTEEAVTAVLTEVEGEKVPPPETRGAWGTTIPSAADPTPAEGPTAGGLEEKLKDTHISSPEQQATREPVLETLQTFSQAPAESNPTPDSEHTTVGSEDILENPHISSQETLEVQDPTLETLSPTAGAAAEPLQPSDPSIEDIEASESEGSDNEGWITPSNLKKHQEKDANGSAKPDKAPMRMEVVTVTSDFAIQNVLLRMNLNLMSPNLQRIRQLKNWVLRCHACFYITKDMSKQFCTRCGKPTLLRTSCSTDKDGNFKVHLKKNMQWNTRGNVYSMPKPVAGASNGKLVAGGGKGGWGQSLILAEDQKEYIQAMTGARRNKEKDLMDEDYLPNLLSGDRGRAGGRPKVGAGKNVNSKKRR